MANFSARVVASLLAIVTSATAIPKRLTAVSQSPFSGTIVAPTAGGVIVPGDDFAFEYTPSSWCESAYSPFTVYLTEGSVPPTFDNVTANGSLADGTFVFSFGEFVTSNFGLPAQGIAPPPSLSVPAGLSLTALQTELPRGLKQIDPARDMQQIHPPRGTQIHPPRRPASVPSPELNTVPQFYLAVVQEFQGCPGDIAEEYSLVTTPVTINSAV